MIKKTRSIYARKFDRNSHIWVDNADINEAQIRSLERSFNEKLRYIGYVFLRDVYEALCIPIDSSSIVVGWFYDSGNAFVDNYIEFAFDPIEGTSDFWIDFNVDGSIVEHFR